MEITSKVGVAHKISHPPTVNPGSAPVGYYVDRFENGEYPTDGGVQWISSTDVIVYQRFDIPRVDIKG